MRSQLDTRKAQLREQLREARQWLDDHGSTRAAYVERYGAASNPNHYGDGGEAIYAADVAEVERLEAALARLTEPS